jgi:hypothetical protein
VLNSLSFLSQKFKELTSALRGPLEGMSLFLGFTFSFSLGTGIIDKGMVHACDRRQHKALLNARSPTQHPALNHCTNTK